jgi:transposase-like protein
LISNHFSKGFEQPGSGQTVVRRGGVYVLEGVMNASAQYHRPVCLKPLCAFVRDNTRRDRAGGFEPQLVDKGQTRFDGFDDKILSLYARGMTVCEIQGDLAEPYGTEVSPDLISRVTDAVLSEVREWRNRPLDQVYPVVFFDALRVKIRDEGLVKNKAVYVALALNPDG